MRDVSGGTDRSPVARETFNNSKEKSPSGERPSSVGLPLHYETCSGQGLPSSVLSCTDPPFLPRPPRTCERLWGVGLVQDSPLRTVRSQLWALRSRGDVMEEERGTERESGPRGLGEEQKPGFWTP